MPPRGAKKGGSAKKSTPKSKQEAATPSIPVEETKVFPSEVKQEKLDKEKENVAVETEVTTTTVVVETKVAEDVEMDGNVSEEEPEPEEAEGVDEAQVKNQQQEATQGGEGEKTVAEGSGEGNENEGNGGEADSSGSDEEDDEDPSTFMELPLTERKKQKDLEIFVGGLDKKAVEEDLTKVFGEFGEIKAIRLVKHPVTQKSKGYAFLRYATVDQAKKVLTELKDGIEVKGKRVGISASQDSDTLYLGNICKTWTKEQVLETLKSLGVEQIEEIYLPEDPDNEGKFRGFGFLEFSTHSEAMAAFQRLRKPDAILGRNRSAKVAFAQSMHPSEEALSKVKTVYVEGLPDSWDEGKLKEFCKVYGEVEKIQLSCNLVKTKRKDFGFVSFTSRENALACVEGINNAQMGEGDIKFKASLAKPEYKGRLGKTTRGGYMIPKDGETIEEPRSSKKKGNAKFKGSETEKVSNLKSAKGKNQSKPKGKVSESQGPSAPTKSDKNRQRNEPPAKGKKREGRSINTGNSGRPSKKPRGNLRSRPNVGSHSERARQIYCMAPIYAADPYRQGYTLAGSSYQSHSYGTAPVSTHSYSDMEPHAGYLRPGARKQDHDVYGYGPRSGTAYGGGAAVAPAPGYGPPSYSSYAEHSSGGSYVYPSSGAYPSRQAYY